MEGIEINDRWVSHYSYIVYPYKKFGDLVNVFDIAKKKNRQISLKLREYFCS